MILCADHGVDPDDGEHRPLPRVLAAAGARAAAAGATTALRRTWGRRRSRCLTGDEPPLPGTVDRRERRRGPPVGAAARRRARPRRRLRAARWPSSSAPGLAALPEGADVIDEIDLRRAGLAGRRPSRPRQPPAAGSWAPAGRRRELRLAAGLRPARTATRAGATPSSSAASRDLAAAGVAAVAAHERRRARCDPALGAGHGRGLLTRSSTCRRAARRRAAGAGGLHGPARRAARWPPRSRRAGRAPGRYVAVAGPAVETPAEAAWLRALRRRRRHVGRAGGARRAAARRCPCCVLALVANAPARGARPRRRAGRRRALGRAARLAGLAAVSRRRWPERAAEPVQPAAAQRPEEARVTWTS